MTDLDLIDQKIIAELRQDGRLPTSELADRVGLSPTPCSRRVRRLEQQGVILGYRAEINPSALGLNICVLIEVKLAKHNPDGHEVFLAMIRESPEVTDCKLVTGDADYMLEARFPDIQALRDFITTTLQKLPEVAETSTMLVVDAISTG